MSEFIAKIGIKNNQARICLVYIEPWAGDYTLLPGESLEIHARNSTVLPWFNIVEHAKCIQAYIEVPAFELRNTTFEVYQEGKPIECGHNRQLAIATGIYK
jgi:hypothetical protein